MNTLKTVGLVSIVVLLISACSRSIQLEKIYGIYTAMTPVGAASLVIKSDQTWEYRIGKDNRTSGQWSDHSPSMDDGLRIGLDKFTFGFSLSSFHDPQKPVLWPALFEQPFFGPIRTCVSDAVCFVKTV